MTPALGRQTLVDLEATLVHIVRLCLKTIKQNKNKTKSNKQTTALIGERAGAVQTPACPSQACQSSSAIHKDTARSQLSLLDVIPTHPLCLQGYLYTSVGDVQEEKVIQLSLGPHQCGYLQDSITPGPLPQATPLRTPRLPWHPR